MPNNAQEERLRWIKPVLDKEITIKWTRFYINSSHCQLNSPWLKEKLPRF